MNVLVGEITSYKAICVSKYLKKNYSNINVFTYDHRPFTNRILTKYSDRHFITKPNEVYDISKIIYNNKIDVFLPVMNDSLEHYLGNKNVLNNSFNYYGELSKYSNLNNKNKLYKIAKKLEVKVPIAYHDIKSAKVPFVVKPESLSSSKGVKYIFNEKDRHEIQQYADTIGDLVIQQYIKGEGVGYSVFAHEGDIEIGYGHRRLAEYPVSGGSSVYREGFYDERMEKISKLILEYCDWSGFAMFEFKLTPENELYLIEVNPRIWGSINQGLQNGINFFEPILGRIDNINSKNYVGKEINTYISPLLYLSFISYIIKNNDKNPIIKFIKNFNSNKADVSILDDPNGYLSTIMRKLIHH